MKKRKKKVECLSQVEGVGLESQRTKVPWVQIPILPVWGISLRRKNMSFARIRIRIET